MVLFILLLAKIGLHHELFYYFSFDHIHLHFIYYILFCLILTILFADIFQEICVYKFVFVIILKLLIYRIKKFILEAMVALVTILYKALIAIFKLIALSAGIIESTSCPANPLLYINVVIFEIRCIFIIYWVFSI